MTKPVWRLLVPATVLACLASACGSAQKADPATAAAHFTATVSGVAGCALPAVPPVPGAVGAAFDGGAVTSTFTFTDPAGDALTVSPPRHADQPTVPVIDAECTGLAASTATTTTPVDPQAGVSIGYGLVTVPDGVLSGAASYPSSFSESGVLAPDLAAPTPYHARLAWVVVEEESGGVSSGGDVRITSPPADATSAPAVPTTPPIDYQVFIMDAGDGSDPLLFNTGTAVAQIPFIDWSVPWTLVSVDARDHGYSGTIQATVLACDGYSLVAYVDRNDPTLQLEVNRPISATCGASKVIRLTVNAGLVVQSLPTPIVHAATGPVLPDFSTQTQPSQTTSSAPIVSLGSSSYATTVQRQWAVSSTSPR